MNEPALRAQIVRIGQLLYEKGFISASDGNISARLSPGRILITPSGLHKGFLEEDQLLLVDEAGNRQGPSTFSGRKLKATSELPLHLEVYRRRTDVGAVVHAHPPITVALSIAGIPLAECLLPETIVFLGLIPTTQYATPSTEESIRAICDFIPNHDALILQRHGSLTIGEDPMQAFMRLETMEQNARIAFMLAQLGIRNPLPPEEVAKLLEQRAAMGLSKPGEAEAFCTVCGVCHSGTKHSPTLRLQQNSLSPLPEPDRVEWLQSLVSNSDGLIPSGSQTPSPDQIRQLVTQIVQKTLGGSE